MSVDVYIVPAERHLSPVKGWPMLRRIGEDANAVAVTRCASGRILFVRSVMSVTVYGLGCQWFSGHEGSYR